MNPAVWPIPQARAAPAEVACAPEVSVCIANWNRRDLLHACLTSLLRSVDVRLEIVVVENGSTDGSAEMVACAFPDVRLVRLPVNLGFARANNLAAQQARGEYLFFLNNDTEVAPETVTQLLDEARRRPEIGVLAPLLRDPDGHAQLSCRRAPTVGLLVSRLAICRWTGLGRRAYQQTRGRESDLSRSVPVEVVMGAALFIRRDRFVRTGGWDEAFTFGGEDIDLCTRIGKHHPVVYFPEAEVLHHGRASSRDSGGFAYLHTRLGMIRYLRKHDGRALWLYKLLLAFDLPFQALVLIVQYLYRRWLGRKAEAERSRRALCDVWHFLRHGLGLLWRA